MKIELGLTTLELCDLTGAILSFSRKEVPLIQNLKGKLPLIRLQFRDEKGDFFNVSSDHQSFRGIEKVEGAFVLSYDSLGQKNIKVQVRLVPDLKSESIHFFLKFEHQLDGYLEWAEFPGVLVADCLVGSGGDARLFWPSNEGILIEDSTLRERSGFKYRPANYPNHGWGGYYPGCAPMAFMSYDRQNQGLYFATHDPAFGTKEIEWEPTQEGIRMIIKIFPGALKKGAHQLDYPVIIGGFEGDWMKAASFYRDWIEASSPFLPPKIAKNPRIPAWIQDSPVVVTYPVTGVGHHSGPTQANEFYPYAAAMPVMNQIAGSTESPLLALLMHWEGTAPWSPPYSWPPMGGEALMKDFSRALHEKGHHLGLYCSGLAWTNRSDTGSGQYRRQEELEKKGLIRHMCGGPKGERESLICNGDGIRYGYDICAGTEFARSVMSEEAVKIANGEIDYIQLFDQNLGGASYQCYDEAHGHPSGPGPWQAEAMRKVLQSVRQELEKAGKGEVVLGCEAAAADAYVDHLPMNDLRFNMGFNYGRPVPAYSFVYHQYAINFMGNQVEAGVAIDFFKSPENLYLRMAHAFISGDLLTLVLGEGGKVHWSWCTKWSVPFPEQKPILEFTKQMNGWRRGAGNKFLVYGRMIEPVKVKSQEAYELHLNGRGTLRYESVLSTKWRSEEGEEAQFVVNYRTTPQKIEVKGKGRVWELSGKEFTEASLSEEGLRLNVPPLTVLMISFNK